MADPVLENPETEERVHSMLSASASHRWLNCPKSVKLCEDLPDESSPYAQEGTEAHELCAYKLLTLLKRKVEPPKFEYDKLTEDCADGYVAFVAEKITKSSTVLVEQRVDYSEYTAANSFGTADCIVIDDGILSIVDYKHGMGVPVHADHNPQMMLYALGAYSLLGNLYEIEKVSLSIYQPRISNISTAEMTLQELLDYAENEIRPKAQLAFKDEGEFACGDWCRFCKAKNICRKRAEANLAVAREEFASAGPRPEANTLSEEEIAELLPKLDLVIQWANDLKDYAFEEALKGKEWPGFKLVYGRAVRKYTDEAKIAEIVKNAGFDPYEQKVLGITAMTKLLGTKTFNELLSDYCVKGQGKLTLVPDSDKRPAAAVSDFKDIE